MERPSSGTSQGDHGRHRAAEVARGGAVTSLETFRVGALAALRAEGYRLTQQRGVLIDLIGQSADHLNADDLYRLARARDGRISLSTVYRTLSLLKRQKLVAEIHLSEDHHHYEPVTGDAHYHLVCRQCGGVEEFGAQVIETLSDALRRDYGFTINNVELDVTGTCRSCTD